MYKCNNEAKFDHNNASNNNINIPSALLNRINRGKGRQRNVVNEIFSNQLYKKNLYLWHEWLQPNNRFGDDDSENKMIKAEKTDSLQDEGEICVFLCDVLRRSLMEFVDAFL